jgi:adenylosuccinate lyase
MKVWTEKADFRTQIEADPDIAKTLSKQEIAACFDVKHHLAQVDTIFKRVFDAR